MCVCAHGYRCLHRLSVTDPMELELQAMMRHVIQGLRTDLASPGRAAHALRHSAISPTHDCFLSFLSVSHICLSEDEQHFPHHPGTFLPVVAVNLHYECAPFLQLEQRLFEWRDPSGFWVLLDSIRDENSVSKLECCLCMCDSPKLK